ncbi:MAG TPA: phosphatidate cytidylyltransferase [Lapillicoccus sp.]|uniref:phosphatidate cytidylyltransferase n=1 Tax=Lapillicoccus sp. TaxID=1909287 RepID=UPI002F9487A6
MTDEPATASDEPQGAVVAPVTTEAQSVKVSRAGRNLPAAFTVGLSLGAAVVVTLFFVPKWTFVVLATAAVCVGVWELCRALKAGGFNVPIVPSIVGCISMLGAAYVGGAQALLVCFALTCVAILVWRVADGVVGAARDVMGGALVAAYPSLLAGFSSLLLAPDDGAWRMFTFIAVTVASDIGGYTVGVLAGRHPMAPTISPKKSWEGFAGSVVFCMVVGVASVYFTLHGAWWVGLVAGAAAAVGATAGDLVESTIKRDLGIKDMSNILPGHGGLMDRLDSLLMNVAIIWAVLAVLVPVGGG